jgi:dTDP-4-amino-4,6-dideoxygalactose transaminase
MMERIPLVDLHLLHRPLGDELLSAAARVLASGRFILGPEVAAFERELAAAMGVATAVGVSSGTDALQALLLGLGVGSGDEVITTAYSFIATAEAIVRVGARPVFADVEPETLNLDPRAVSQRFSARSKAVLAVHLFGRPAPLGPLGDACARAGVPLPEDAA